MYVCIHHLPALLAHIQSQRITPFNSKYYFKSFDGMDFDKILSFQRYSVICTTDSVAFTDPLTEEVTTCTTLIDF